MCDSVISCALITADVSLIMDQCNITQLSPMNDSFCLHGAEVIMSSSGDIPVVIFHGLGFSGEENLPAMILSPSIHTLLTLLTLLIQLPAV